MFSKVTLGNTQTCRTEAEISDESGNVVALVYENDHGWEIKLFREIQPEEVKDFDAVVSKAKDDLSHYVNRKGINPPEDLTAGGMSLWLMEKDDGTVLGLDLRELEKRFRNSSNE